MSFMNFFPSSELTSTSSPEVEREVGGGRGERREGGGRKVPFIDRPARSSGLLTSIVLERPT